MRQRYKIFLLFIIVLNYFLFSCIHDHTSEAGQMSGKKNRAMGKTMQIGDKAPDFSLPDQYGKRVNLSDFSGKVNLVVYFYPKDESFGCTREACCFRDSYKVFKEAGAEVIGISADDVSSHQAFAANHKLPFILLSDKDRSVGEKYGVGKSMGVLPGRVTFVIDKQGVIQMMFSSQLNFQKHVDESLEVLRRLKNQ